MKNTLRKYFIPHEHNNYHPHILHFRRAVLYSGLAIVMKAIVFIFALSIPTAVYVSPDVLALEQAQIISSTNILRESLGLPKLRESAKLNFSAQLKSEDMSAKQEFSHVSNDGKGLKYFLAQAGYRYTVAGENLAMGYSQINELMSAWKKSQTHYNNLVDTDYQEVGVGIVGGLYNDIPTIYVTEHFATPKQEVLVATEPVAPATVETQTEPAKPTTTATTPEPTKPTATQTPENNLPKEQPVINPALPTAPVVEETTIDNPTVDDVSATETLVEENVAGNPIVYEPEKSKLTWEEIKDGTKVNVSVALAGPIDSVRAFIQNNTVILSEMSEGVYQGSFTVSESPEHFFKVIFPAEIKIVATDGTAQFEPIYWETIPVAAPSPLERYFAAKKTLGSFMGFLEFSKYVYLGLFIFFATALFLSIVIEWRRQHYRSIAHTSGLLLLFILLYLF